MLKYTIYNIIYYLLKFNLIQYCYTYSNMIQFVCEL